MRIVVTANQNIIHIMVTSLKDQNYPRPTPNQDAPATKLAIVTGTFITTTPIHKNKEIEFATKLNI